MAGKIIDGANGGKFYEVGKWQTGLGISNDIGSFVFSGGTRSSIYGLMSTHGYVRGSLLFTIGNNYYSIWNYGNTKK